MFVTYHLTSWKTALPRGYDMGDISISMCISLIGIPTRDNPVSCNV